MINQDEAKRWIELNCSLIWSLLNQRARQTLPIGLIEYINRAPKGARSNLLIIERYLTWLKKSCEWRVIANNYRRDLSGVNCEDRVAELFCEIALCASLGKISDKLQLRPPTGRGTFSDCLINLFGFDIYGEAKRYNDPWHPIDKPASFPNEDVPSTRSIVKRPIEKRPHCSARPWSMDLRSKLQNVHRQFPKKSFNILFVFLCSFVEVDPKQNLTQALFGDSNFDSVEDFALEPDGLFSVEEWRIISACCLVRIDQDAGIMFLNLWKNPRALDEIPSPVFEAFSPKHSLALKPTT